MLQKINCRFVLAIAIGLGLVATPSEAQWVEKNNGLYGGRVISLATTGTNLFAGTEGSGVFLSTNNGTSWTAVNTGLTNQFIYDLVVSGTNLFAGTDGGVFLSANNGTSWTAVNTGLNQYTTSLAVSGTNLFAGTFNGGVFLSTNNGTTWTAVNTGITNLNIISLAINGTSLFAGTLSGGVFRSTDNGTTWAAVNTGITSQYIKSLAVSGTNLFAGTFGGGVFLSTNNGTSWTAVNTGLATFQVHSLAVSGTNLFAGTTSGVFLSTNNGTSWTAVSTGLTNQTIFELAVSGTNLFAGTYGGGVFLSGNNGTSWTSVNTGLTNLNIYSLAVNGTNLFAGTYYNNGVFLSTNNGTNWTAVNTGLTDLSVLSLVVSGTNLFAGTNGGGVFLSINNGANWTAVNTGLINQLIHSLAVSGSNLFAGTSGGGVFLSTNNGTSWTAVNTGLTNLDIRSLAVSGTNLFAGTYGGGVSLSTNNGTSWTAANSGLTNLNISSLAVSGTNLLAGTYGGGVFLSTNNGTSWIAVNTGIDPNIFSLAISGTNLFAGTAGGGVFLSTNNGTSWTAVNTGLVDKTIFSLAINGTNLFAGTGSRGTWSRPLSEIIPPAITSFTPSSGAVGTPVTITGTNFDPTPANNTVKFNGTTAIVNPSGSTSTNLNVIVPAGATTGTITVAVAGQTATSSSNFTVAPTISNFAPSSGGIGTPVTITGTNFDPTPANNTVKFNGTTAVVNTSSSSTTSLSVTVPSGATTGSITVTALGQTATSSSNFTVVPTISNFNPTGGGSGTSVIITGTSFNPTAANNTVKFNGTTAVVSVSTSTSITTTVPAGTTSGPITVTVAGQTATSQTNFIIDTTPPNITGNTTPLSVTLGAPVPVSITVVDNESPVQSVKVSYGPANSATLTAQDVNMTNSSGNTWQYSIPAASVTELGLYYKVQAFSSGGSTTYTSYHTAVTNAGTGLTIPYSSFGSAVSNYRIIAVPLTLTSKTVNDVFGDDLDSYGDKSKWRMYRYENGATNELTGSSSIDPGKGYWLIARSQSTIGTGTGTSVQANTDTPFQINLVSGWNQIGNPYNFNLSWADVQAANPGLPGLRIYNGDFTDATRLDKMQGGFVNVSAATTLKFPVVKNASVNGRINIDPPVQMNALDNSDWQVNLKLEQGERTNLISGFGMNAKASEKFDTYDGINMPKFFDEFLILSHSKKKENDTYSKDIVPFSENHIWEFSVESSSSGSPITFYWDNSYFGQNAKQLYLWDVSQQLAIDMRSHQSYSFNKESSQSFKVLYGSEGFVKEKTSVQQLVLHNIWPNPASDNVTISFSLPDSSEEMLVEFSLYDVTGRRTQILQGDFNEGYHEVNLKRGDFAPGVYVIDLSSGSGSKRSRIAFK